MKNHFNKILFLVLGIVSVPFFTSANIEKSVSDFTAANFTCSAGSSIAKFASATWNLTGIEDINSSAVITWSGSGVSGTESSAPSTYSTAGTVNDVVVTIADESGSVQVACDSLNIKDTTTGGSDNNEGGSTGGGRRLVSPVNVVAENATPISPAQDDIDNLVAWLRDNPNLFSPLPQTNIVALDLENPIASTTLATNDNGTSSTSTVASSTESENNLAAAAATASGSAAKYAWYIAGIILLGLIGWLVFFLLKRRNKKDKIS
jgi:hypothetical protein